MSAPRRTAILILALAVAATAAGCQDRLTLSSREAPPPNVLLIVVDTLRADQTSLERPELATTPNLERLAREGTVFRAATSTAPWTMPATASLLTGQHPGDHGVLRFGDRIDARAPHLAERLRAAGYQSRAVVGNALLQADRGFARGFDHWDVLDVEPVTSPEITARAIAWLQQRDPAAPFLLYLHYMDPHAPYLHHPEHDRSSTFAPSLASSGDIVALRQQSEPLGVEDLTLLERLYQEEVAFTDLHIGRVLDALETLGLADDTVIVVTADHGEELGDHGGLGHGRSLFVELLRVPLVVRAPGLAPGASDAPVSLVDVAPTVLELTGDRPDALRGPGRSLVGLMREGRSSATETRPLFADTVWGERIEVARDLPLPDPRLEDSSGWIPAPPPPPPEVAFQTSLSEGRWKLIHDQLNDWWLLFDVQTDPAERTNLYGGHAEEQRLQARLLRWENEVGADAASRLRTPDTLDLTPGEIDQLRALGYVR